MAPHYIFYNGPAGNTSRFGFYGVGATPTVKVDGLAASYNPSTYATSINNRLSVPTDIAIDVNCVGDATGGTAYVSVTAEAAPPSGSMNVWVNILEDHEIATGSWGGYNGQEMMWIPVARPLGTNGQAVNFTGPYPQTLQFEGTYTLSPTSHPFDNLNVSAWVQLTGGTKEVMNAFFEDLPDTGTGIYEAGEAAVEGSALLGAWPNPSTGAFSVSSFVPQGAFGEVEIFDLSGRTVQSFAAGSIENVFIEEPGLYFVRLTASNGEIVNRQVAIIR